LIPLLASHSVGSTQGALFEIGDNLRGDTAVNILTGFCSLH
jgi:hypothetical protein